MKYFRVRIVDGVGDHVTYLLIAEDEDQARIRASQAVAISDGVFQLWQGSDALELESVREVYPDGNGVLDEDIGGSI